VLTDIETAKTLIIERSRELVEKLINKRGHDTPPFLSEEFASLLGIMRVEKGDLGRTSGILIEIPGNPIIKVNQSHNKERQNFSCAHELAHHLLRELKLELDTENISYRTFNPGARGRTISMVRERLCNAAASELLMPEPIFRKYLATFGVSIHAIERLASVFEVSILAAARRTAEVSEEPCITLLWKPQIRTKGLRLVWCVDSEAKSAWKASYVPVQTKIKHTSTLYKAYEQDSNIIKCYKKFKYGTDDKRFLPMESKGFGRGENRYVISLAFLNG